MVKCHNIIILFLKSQNRWDYSYLLALQRINVYLAQFLPPHTFYFSSLNTDYLLPNMTNVKYFSFYFPNVFKMLHRRVGNLSASYRCQQPSKQYNVVIAKQILFYIDFLLYRFDSMRMFNRYIYLMLSYAHTAALKWYFLFSRLDLLLIYTESVIDKALLMFSLEKTFSCLWTLDNSSDIWRKLCRANSICWP